MSAGGGVGKSVYIGYNAPFVWIAETRGTHCASYILSQVKFGYRSGADPNPSLIRNSGKTSSAFGHVRLPITGDPYNRSFIRPSHSLSNALLPKKQEPYFFSPRVTGVSHRLFPAFFISSCYHVSLHKRYRARDFSPTRMKYCTLRVPVHILPLVQLIVTNPCPFLLNIVKRHSCLVDSK